MNHPADGSASSGHDDSMLHSNGYGGDRWLPLDLSPYNSPMDEYGDFVFRLPSEPLGRMPPPPVQSGHHQMLPVITSAVAHQRLPLLATAWPSQLTNPTPSSYSAPPLSMAPMAHHALPETPQALTPAEKPRRTLSTEQKRAMCQYHEDNPGTKQADIGLKFGVERSTVSKVLRHRDQYLRRDQDTLEPSAAKRARGKYPDFDRTLTNYVRRQQQRGFDVKDEEIMEQARLFAHGSGNQENLLKKLTSGWLHKFKQKHGLGTPRLMRRASETNIPDSAKLAQPPAEPIARRHKSGAISPASPYREPSPASVAQSDEEAQPDGLEYEFNYKTVGSHSTTSLSSNVGDTRSASLSSFSADTTSPLVHFDLSPDPNVGAFAIRHSLAFPMDTPAVQLRETRSNTFPSLNLDYVNKSPTLAESATPRHRPIPTASSAVESPASEPPVAPFAIDASLASPPATLRRSSSGSSVAGRSNATPLPGTPVDASPVSPSQEDARRAANTLLNYLQSGNATGQFDHSEYLALIQLTKKLQLHKHQPVRPARGVLSRILEGDGEATPLAGQPS